MNVYLCDFMTEDMHAPCLIIAWIFFIKITHTAKRSRRVGYLTMYKKLYTNGFRKVCSDPIIFSAIARAQPRRKFFGNLGKLNFSFPLFHFSLGL